MKISKKKRKDKRGYLLRIFNERTLNLLQMIKSEYKTVKEALGDLELSEIKEFSRLFDGSLLKYNYRKRLYSGNSFGE